MIKDEQVRKLSGETLRWDESVTVGTPYFGHNDEICCEVSVVLGDLAYTQEWGWSKDTRTAKRSDAGLELEPRVTNMIREQVTAMLKRYIVT